MTSARASDNSAYALTSCDKNVQQSCHLWKLGRNGAEASARCLHGCQARALHNIQELTWRSQSSSWWSQRQRGRRCSWIATRASHDKELSTCTSRRLTRAITFSQILVTCFLSIPAGSTIADCITSPRQRVSKRIWRTLVVSKIPLRLMANTIMPTARALEACVRSAGMMPLQVGERCTCDM